ncbi:MAG: TonB-dependent receptor [Candidatus Omnitrophota bacterium]
MLFKRCGLFIFVWFFLRSLLSAAENPTLDLEPIIITKSSIYSPQAYICGQEKLPYLFGDSAVEGLRYLPVDLQSRLPAAGVQMDFSLRGSNYQGVLLLLDGQRINDPQTGHHNADLPLTREDLERVEVITGAPSSIYGSDAIGGAINFIVRKPVKNQVVVESSLGGYGTSSELLSFSVKKENLGVRVSVENKESAGFREDTDFKKFTASVVALLELSDQELSLNWGYQEKEFGAYDFYTPGSGYLSKEWTKTYLANIGLNLNGDGFIMKPNLLWRRHYDKFMLDKTQQRSRYLNHHRTDIITPNIYFQKETEALGVLGLGLEYGQEDISSTNLGKYNREHKSIYMDDSRKICPQGLLGLSYRLDDFDSFGGVHTGSANFKYDLNNNNRLHFGVSRSMRIPSFTELYYNDPTTLGNIGLEAEKAWNYQSGFERKIERGMLGITFFLRIEEGSIDWVKRTSTQDKWQVENIKGNKVPGVENYLKFRLNRSIDLDVNYTYINKRTDEKGYIYKYGTNYARHLINNSLFFKLPFGVQALSFTYKKKPNRDGWLLVESRFNYEVNKQTQFFLKISNLFNVEYQEIESIPQPGRWVEVGFRIIF